MTSEDTGASFEGRIVVRLLNSPLRGCEFQLQAGRTLFVVGPPAEQIATGQSPELPEDTIYVPLEQDGVNFELMMDAADSGTLTLRKLEDSGTEELPVSFNQPLHVGGLILALRPEHLPWSPEILAYPENLLQDASKPSRRNPILAAVLAVIAMLLVAGGSYLHWSNPQRQAAELSSLLGHDKQRFRVLQGRDGVFYVATMDERDSSWARQVIARGDYDRPAQVIDPDEENERIAHWLADHYPELAYYRLQMDDPSKPQLWISQQRAGLNALALQRLSQILTKLMPYAQQVEVLAMDDRRAAQQAEAGLTHQALPFTRNDRPDGITFVIEGALGDGELQRARSFVTEYYRQWGSRYVKFAIELKDDWLKGRSFRYGGQGYVKMGPSHWYFPKPL